MAPRAPGWQPMDGVVTAVVPQERGGGRRANVFIDGRFAFSLDRELADRIRLGDALTAAQIAELERQDLEARAWDGALAFLAPRPRSEREVRTRLQRKGFSTQVIDGVIERLKRVGLLDDRAFARYWVEQRETFRPRGARLLAAELRQRGVAGETITEVLEASAQHDPVQAACRAAQRKARELRQADERTFVQRVGQFLLRRGFDYETARAACRRLWSEEHETK